MIEIIPLKIYLKNFRSHRDSEIDFGEPDWKIFVTGESGSGKTTILFAFQYLFGNDILGYDDFFHQESKTGEYAKVAQIKLEVFNQNYELNKTYGLRFSIVLDVKRDGDKIKPEWHIESGAEKTRLYKQDLKQFVDPNDPFTFVPSDTLTTWMKLTPLERYKKVMNLIGVTETHKKFDEARKRRDETNLTLMTHKNNLTLLEKELELQKKDYDVYLTSEGLKRRVMVDEQILLLAIATKCLNDHVALLDLRGQNLIRLENLETQASTETRSITHYQERLTEFDEASGKLVAEKESLEGTLAKLQDIKGEIQGSYNQFKESTEKVANFPVLEEVDSLLKITNQSYFQITSEVNAGNERIKVINRELDKLEKGIWSPDELSERFLELLHKNDIDADFLFKTLNIKPGMEEWIPLIESALGNDRTAIVVKKEEVDIAYKIRNEQMHEYRRPILGIKNTKWYSKGPITDFRNWTDILEITSSSVPPEEIEAILNRKLGSVYFIENRDEKDEIFNKSHFSTIFCLDKFLYLDYKSEAFSVPAEFCIGKAGAELMKQSLASEKFQLENEIHWKGQKLETLSADLGRCQVMRDDWNEFIKLQEKIKNWETEGTTPESISLQISDLIRKRDEKVVQIEQPERAKQDINYTISQAQIRLKQIESDKIILDSDQNSILAKITETAILYGEKMKEWLLIDGSGPADQEIMLENIEETGVNYTSIKYDNRLAGPVFRGLIPNPEPLEIELKNMKTQLEILPKFPLDIAIIYHDSLDKHDFISHEIESTNDQFDRINKDMADFKNEIDDKVSKWYGIINDNFKTIIKDLQLEGDLQFNLDNDEEGMRRIDYSISSRPGAPRRTNMKTFSDGEKARISMAFLVAVLKERSASFFMWDEFEGKLDDKNRELVGIIINNHIPGKAIVISPLALVKQHFHSFQRILYLAKNKDGNSLVKHLDTNKLKFLEGTLFEYAGKIGGTLEDKNQEVTSEKDVS